MPPRSRRPKVTPPKPYGRPPAHDVRSPLTTPRQQGDSAMPGTTIKIRSSGGGEFDCYLALPARRRQAAGDRAGLRRARRRQGHPRPRRRVRRRTATSRPRPICSGARSRARSPARRRARAGALAAAAREDQGRRARHGRHARASAHAAAVQRPRRGDGLLLRRPLRDPRAEAARLRRRHLLPRHAHARLHRRAQGRHRAGLHHLGRPGSRRAAPRCSTPIARCRRACRTSRCISSPACCTAT